MDAINFLRQYEDAEKRIARCERELEEESIMIDAIKSLSDRDGMPHGNGISKPTEDKAIRLADKMQRVANARIEAVHIRQDVFDVINKVGGDEADVLYQRYILLKKWADVCSAVHWSWFKVNGLHQAGLEKVDAIIK